MMVNAMNDVIGKFYKVKDYLERFRLANEEVGNVGGNRRQKSKICLIGSKILQMGELEFQKG